LISVKAILALALLALLGFLAAGCGATKKIVVKVETSSPSTTIADVGPGTITVVGSATTTIPNVTTGTRIKCKGWPGRGVKVPPPGTQANVGGGKATPNGTLKSHVVQLTHLANGSLTVSCTSS
jgi:hypothetical protein